MRGPASALRLALLLGTAALVVLRFQSLLFQPNILTARNERRFFGWAYGAEGLVMRRQLPEAAPAFAPGETVCFTGEFVNSAGQPPKDALWGSVMASYFLSRQVVVTPSGISKDPGPGCRRTLLQASPNSPLRIVRSSDAVAR